METRTCSPILYSVQEEQNRGKPNWEHLNEDLHVLITVEDSQNRAEIKLKRAVEEVKKLLVPAVSHVFTLEPPPPPSIYQNTKFKKNVTVAKAH